ncbi:MAG: hypothetical protein AAFV53_07390 [Myxococcota bacterium]
MMWMLTLMSAVAAEPAVSESAASDEILVRFESKRAGLRIGEVERGLIVREFDEWCIAPCEATLSPGRHYVAVKNHRGQVTVRTRIDLSPDEKELTMEYRPQKKWALISGIGLSVIGLGFTASAAGQTDVTCDILYDDYWEQSSCRSRIAAERNQAVSTGLGFQLAGIAVISLSTPTLKKSRR